MRGTYAWAYAATNSGGPYSTSGRESYDGYGHVKWFQLFNSAGTESFTYSGTGTHTMTADCVASVVYGLSQRRSLHVFRCAEWRPLLLEQ